MAPQVRERPPMKGDRRSTRDLEAAHHGEDETDAGGHERRTDKDPEEFAYDNLAHADRRREHGLEDRLEGHSHVEAVAAFEEGREERGGGYHAWREVLRVGVAVDSPMNGESRVQGQSS